MGDPILRVFSYLPNPRVWKAMVVARLGGATIDVVGDKPKALADWLWDIEPRPLDPSEKTEDNPNARQSRRGFSATLYKTDAFLEAHPFGTVPAAFSPHDGTGIFESNSILRAAARAVPDAGLYGTDAYSASRIDSFLDAALVFAREAQVYLLALGDGATDAATHARMRGAYEFFLSGTERALSTNDYLAGQTLSIADIGFAFDLAQFLREGHYKQALEAANLTPVAATFDSEYPRSAAHMNGLAERPEFEELKAYLRWYRDGDR